VLARVQDEGTCWVGGTKWQGQVAMRLSISNWSTIADDVDRSAAAMLAALDRTEPYSRGHSWRDRVQLGAHEWAQHIANSGRLRWNRFSGLRVILRRACSCIRHAKRTIHVRVQLEPVPSRFIEIRNVVVGEVDDSRISRSVKLPHIQTART
jgi:hypothetical protein